MKLVKRTIKDIILFRLKRPIKCLTKQIEKKKCPSGLTECNPKNREVRKE